MRSVIFPLNGRTFTPGDVIETIYSNWITSSPSQTLDPSTWAPNGRSRKITRRKILKFFLMHSTYEWSRRFVEGRDGDLFMDLHIS
jgi:hypothetical protein